MNIYMTSTPHKYHSGDKTNNNEKGEACGMYGEESSAYRISVGKREGKRQFVRPKRRWSKILKEI